MILWLLASVFVVDIGNGKNPQQNTIYLHELTSNLSVSRSLPSCVGASLIAYPRDNWIATSNKNYGSGKFMLNLEHLSSYSSVFIRHTLYPLVTPCKLVS